MKDSDTPEEAERIRRAQAGEPQAFQQLAHQQAESLFRCALTLCGDAQLAEDLAQETMLAAWQSLRRFDGRCRFSTWLYGILRHRFLKATRGTSWRSRAESLDGNAKSSSPAESDPARDSERAEDAARVQQAVAMLPPEHRQVIELRFFAGATLEDIAAALEIPLGTVKSRLHNGLEKLRQAKFAVNLFPGTGESSARQL